MNKTGYRLHLITPIDNLGKKDLRILRHAVSVAEKSSFKSSKRMASVFCDSRNKLISGENQHRQFYRRNQHKSLHAEVHTIMNYVKTKHSYSLSSGLKMKGTLYIVRLMNSMKGKSQKMDYVLGNSKPCKNCFNYLQKHGIKKVKYTDVVDRFGNTGPVNVLVELRLDMMKE